MGGRDENYLVDQQVGALAVGVVRDHDAVALAAMHLLEDLKGLGAGSRAHVQNDAVGVHVQEHGRKHAHGLLATDVTRAIQSDHVLMKLFERSDLAQLLAVNIDLALTPIRQNHLPRALVLVPLDRVDTRHLLAFIFHRSIEMILGLEIVLDNLKAGVCLVDTERRRQIRLLPLTNRSIPNQTLNHLREFILRTHLLETVVVLEEFALARTRIHRSPHVLSWLLALLPLRSRSSTSFRHASVFFVVEEVGLSAEFTE